MAELAHMKEQKEVRKAEDDWTGVTDTAQRRKLQNRLNQRRYRRARADPLRPPRPRASAQPVDGSLAAMTRTAQRDLATKFRGLLHAVAASGGTLPALRVDGVTISAAVIVQSVDRFERIAQQEFLLGSPRADLLLTLIQFNVLRGLLGNTTTLGWGLEWLECADPVSPWHTWAAASDRALACPASLQPTPVQQQVEHHPWIDLWPFPRMRDNLILALGRYDEDKLCNALIEFEDIPNEQSGLIVWGEPWDPASWEASETFVRRWGWTVQGCTELWQSTNNWRARRGEKRIEFEKQVPSR